VSVGMRRNTSSVETKF